MGLGIGQIPSALSSVTAQQPREASAPERTRPEIALVRRQLGSAEQDSGAGTLLFRGPAPVASPRAGIGAGTVSGPGAALDAINGGVRTARRAVPTLAQIRDDFQIRREQIEAQFTTQNEVAQARQREQRASVETRIPAPSPRALEFFATDRPPPPQPIPEPVRSTALEQSGPPEPIAFASAQAPEAVEFASAEQPADRAIEQQEQQQQAAPTSTFFEGLGNGRLDLTG